MEVISIVEEPWINDHLKNARALSKPLDVYFPASTDRVPVFFDAMEWDIWKPASSHETSILGRC